MLADNGLADLINQHAIQPGAVVVQAVIVLLAMFSTLTAVAGHHQEHWTQSAIRPIGLGLTGLALVEVFKLAAGGVISGSIGL